MPTYRALLCLLVVSFASTLHAQRLREIIIDPNSAAVQAYLPFDEPFIIKGEVDGDVTEVVLLLHIYGQKDSLAAASDTLRATLFHGSGKDKKNTFEFIAKPIPPNRRVDFDLQFTRSVSDLDGFTSEARKAIHAFNLEYMEAGTLQPSDLLKLVATVDGLLKQRYPRYETNIRQTLVGDSLLMSQRFSELHGQIRERRNAFRTIAGNAANLTAHLKTIRDADHIQAFYQHALSVKRLESAYYLSQAISSTDELALEMMNGKAAFATDQFGALSEFSAPLPSIDLSENDATAAVARLKQSYEAVKTIQAYLDIYGDNSAKSFVIGQSRITPDQYAQNLGAIKAALTGAEDALKNQWQQFEKLASNTYFRSLDAFVAQFKVSVTTGRVVTSTTSNTFTTRGSWYISADAGLFVAPELKEVQPTFGAIIYFTPVNKNCNYRPSDIKKIYGDDGKLKNSLRWLSKHGGLTLGFSTRSMEDANKGVKNLWGSTNMLVGVGLRFGPAVRLSGGALLIRGYENGNILSTETTVRATPYVGLSVDLDLIGFFGKVGNALF
jgi:hypothetical protein